MTDSNDAPARSAGRRPTQEDFRAVGARATSYRGRPGVLLQLFDESLIPMIWLDDRRRCVDANAASRLFLHRTREELQRLSADEFLFRSRSPGAVWDELMREGRVAGTSPMRAPDGSFERVDYCGIANLLPDLHLFGWRTAVLEQDELGADALEPARPRTRRLNAREREVLRVLATGASVEQIATGLALPQASVKAHLRDAVRRLGARHRAHAVAIAMRQGEI
jgi:DNA-binding CsgD family transcriptional regulator